MTLDTRTLRIVTAVAAVLLVSSGYGVSLSVRALAFATGAMVLVPWLLGRRTLTLEPLTLLGVLAGLAGLVGGGGFSRLALMSFLVILPAGLAAGSALVDSTGARLAASGAIAATQWIPIVAQHRNSQLILERLRLHPSGPGYGDSFLTHPGQLRPVGTTVSPGLVAFVLLVGIALASMPGPAGSSRPPAAALWCLAAGHAYCLALTGSRTALAALAILAAWSQVASGRWKPAVRAAAILAGGVTVLLVSESSDRVTPRARLEVIRAAMPTLREHWLLGIGWGNTPRYVATAADGVVYHLHFLPLHLVFELGVCGGIAFALLALQLARRSTLIVAVLAPFALADAGIFINATTIFFLGVIIEMARQRQPVPAPAGRAVAAI
ncbi:MAG TPA: O-antigen ligase family protein [Actinomycetes bacterium]|jgi:hypothetical protein|nr:O-antigen ligase family protein [Actinomycetes bacterium]